MSSAGKKFKTIDSGSKQTLLEYEPAYKRPKVNASPQESCSLMSSAWSIYSNPRTYASSNSKEDENLKSERSKERVRSAKTSENVKTEPSNLLIDTFKAFKEQMETPNLALKD